MHHLFSALPVPFVLFLDAPGALELSSKFSRVSSCRTSHYPRTFIPLSVFLLNDLSDDVLHSVSQGSLRAESMLVYYHTAPFLLFSTVFFSFMGRFCGIEVFGLIVGSFSPSSAVPTNKICHYFFLTKLNIDI